MLFNNPILIKMKKYWILKLTDLEEKTMDSFENIAESIFDEATKNFENSFEAIDYGSTQNCFSMLITETKSNGVVCEKIIDLIKNNVLENFSEIFDVSVERQKCSDEFPDDIADIEIFLKWEKVINKQ